MMKHTHMFTGIVVTIPFITWDNAILIPVAVLGSVAADWDYRLGIEHRTSTHSLLALVVSSGALTIFNWRVGLLWALNYITHLLLDSFTKMGVPLLYPFNKKYFGLRVFKTRGAEDMYICLLLLYIITLVIQ